MKIQTNHNELDSIHNELQWNEYQPSSWVIITTEIRSTERFIYLSRCCTLCCI